MRPHRGNLAGFSLQKRLGEEDNTAGHHAESALNRVLPRFEPTRRPGTGGVSLVGRASLGPPLTHGVFLSDDGQFLPETT